MKKGLSHTVWVPKKRRKIVYGKLRKEIGEILRRLSEYKGVDVIEGKTCIDLHVCLSIGREIGIPDCFQRKPFSNTCKGKDLTITQREYYVVAGPTFDTSALIGMTLRIFFRPLH